MKKIIIILILALAAGSAFFFFQSDKSTAAAADMGEMPPIPVDTITIALEPVVVWLEFTGRIAAVDHAIIKPEVSGRITEVKFQDGAHVDQGDLLFVIDPAPLEAALGEAEGAFGIAQSEAALAEKEYQRAKSLRDSDAISESLYQERLSARGTAASAVKAAKALRDRAKINLEYAYIKAPISGKTGRAELTVGNRVESGPNAPVLTEIITLDPLYVEFDIDEQSFVNLKSAEDNVQDTLARIRIEGMDDDIEGKMHSFDNRITAGSGTIRARAIIDNPDGLLIPGMTARLEVGTNDGNDKAVIPSSVIGTDQDRKFVYILNTEGQAEYRAVTLGKTMDSRRIVLDGLYSGDKVITSSIVKLRPGAAVVEKQPEPPTGEMGNAPSAPNIDNTLEEDQTTVEEPSAIEE